MELKRGYKQTEAGVIPIDWDSRRIGDVATVSAGGTPSRDIPRYWNGGIPWITTTQIDANVVTRADQFISREGLENSAAKLLPPGTLLMALYGQGKTRGKVAVLGFEAATNQACAAISLSKEISRDYVFHCLVNKYEEIRNLSNSGSQENLNGLIVKSIPFALPPLPEQLAIAAALGDVDESIGSLDRLIAKKRDLKQAAMQQLLTGERRLPGFAKAHDQFKQTEVGAIPEDWNVSRLGTCGEVVMGQSPPGWSYNRTGIGSPLINGPTEFTEKHPIKIQWTTEPSRFCQANDLLLCVRGSSTGRTNTADDEYSIGRGVAAIRARSGNDSIYLSFQVLSAVTAILAAATGSTFPSIDGVSLRKLPMKMPPTPEEQTAIATVLSDMDAEITGLEQKHDKTRLLKQGMMQELLTGKTRLI